MARTDNLTNFLTDVSTAIKSKIGNQTPIVASSFDEKIMSIPSGGGGGTGYTGHIDEVGLRAIGWDDEDIADWKANGICWNEESDHLYIVPQDNIDLYQNGTLNEDTPAQEVRNIMYEYEDRLLWLPKVNLVGITSTPSGGLLSSPNLIGVPILDFQTITNYQSYAFANAYALVYMPPHKNWVINNGRSLFTACYSLRNLPKLTMGTNCTGIDGMFTNCVRLEFETFYDMPSSVVSATNLFTGTNISIINEVDCQYLTSLTSLANYSALTYVGLKNLKANYSFNVSQYLRRDCILFILNNLQTVTVKTTLTLGATNLAKLTTAEKRIATDKGWTLV